VTEKCPKGSRSLEPSLTAPRPGMVSWGALLRWSCCGLSGDRCRSRRTQVRRWWPLVVTRGLRWWVLPWPGVVGRVVLVPVSRSAWLWVGSAVSGVGVLLGYVGSRPRGPAARPRCRCLRGWGCGPPRKHETQCRCLRRASAPGWPGTGAEMVVGYRAQCVDPVATRKGTSFCTNRLPGRYCATT
jgi:hypothetical protein